MDRQLWPHQKYAIDTGVQKIESGVRSFCITSPTGGGKCLGRDTPVLMYDGSVSPVQDISDGDLLMGPDSSPRRVIGTTRGTGPLFTVTPTKGMPYVVNEHHILALRFTDGTHSQYVEFKNGNGFVEIPVSRYLASSKSMRHVLKGYRVPVSFQTQEVPLDPYYLGIWLGDGTATSTQVTKPGKEIEDAVHAVANEHNCNVTTFFNSSMVPHHSIVRKNGTAQTNPVLEKLRGLGVIQNKHVPLMYLSNSEHVRMEVLAGLMDTDGSPSRSGFDFISKTEQLSKDVAYLARSLGMSAYITECCKECVNNGVWGTYFRVSINGDCDRIPVRIARKRPHPRMQKKDVLSVGIKVTQSGVGEFFGFELDGDGLFLLGDFTVTHNSKIMTGLCEYASSVDKRVAVFTNRRLLTNQLAKGLSSAGIHLGVRAAEFESWTDLNAPVQICSTPTEVARVINRRKKAIDRLMSEDEAHSTYTLFPAEVVIVDEAHLNASERMQQIIKEYRDKHDSTIIGVTATPLGISSLYSELIVAGNMTSLRACGALVPARCFQPTVWDLSKVYRAKHELPSQDAMEAATRAIWTQHVVGSIYTHWKKINSDGKATIAFSPGVKESLGMAQEFYSHGVTSAHISGEGMWVNGKEYKGSKQEDRDEVFAMSKAGEIQVIWNRFVCLDCETEILTSTGWVGMNEMTMDHRVANWTDGAVDFEHPLRVIRRDRAPSERMVFLETPRKSLRVTETHELLYRTSMDGRFRKATAAELVGRVAYLPVSGRAEAFCVDTEPAPVVIKNLARQVTANAWVIRKLGGDPETSRTVALERLQQRSALRRKHPRELTIAECEIIGFWVGDGDKNIKKKSRGMEYRIAQTEGHVNIIQRIEDNLVASGIDYKKTRMVSKNINGEPTGKHHVVFSLARGTGTGKIGVRGVFAIEQYFNKSGTDLLWGLNDEQFDAYLRGLWMADGCPHYDNTELPKARFSICGINRKLFDTLQAIATCRGYRASIRSYERSNEKYQPLLYLSLSKTEFHQMTKYRLQFEESWKPEKVWCVTTTSGNIITRRKGSVTVMGNCREAIDLPWLECLILACPIGSLLSYIQTCGRVLRASPSTGKQSAVIIDHAGSIELHGSPNMDRDQQWIQYFHEDSDKITKDRVNSLRDPENQEPTAITCPKCGAMRKSGPKCINPACGFEHSESVRYILQEHGELVATKESFMPKRKPKMKPDTAKLWERCYWRCKNSKTPKSFNQVRALFIREHGYSPPQGLPLMPKSPLDWSRKIPDVSYADLIHKPK